MRAKGVLVAAAGTAAVAVAMAGAPLWIDAVAPAEVVTLERWRGPDAFDAPSPASVATLPGVVLDRDTTVGDPILVDNLAALPIYSSRQHDVGQVRALPAAIEAGKARVTETPEWSVYALRFASLTHDPVVVLGGSLMAGGRQDRVVSRDHIIAPETMAELAVNCAEEKRWSFSRNGESTPQFRVHPTMVGTRIRAIAELSKDQEVVWQTVDATNKAHCKSPSTHALAGTLDDPTLVAARDAMTSEVLAGLEGQPAPEHMVGLAFTVNGSVTNVRVFANQRLFSDFRELLSRTAAFEALSEAHHAESDQALQGLVEPETSLAQQVVDFVQTIKHQPVQRESKRLAATRTDYLHHPRGYAAIAHYVGADGAVPVTASYVALPREARPTACSVN